MLDSSDPEVASSNADLPLNARVLVKLLRPILDNIEGGKLRILWPGGASTLHGSGVDSVTLELRNYKPFTSLLRAGDIGFAESYLRGDWTCDDLLRFFLLIHQNESNFASRLSGFKPARWANAVAHALKRNSKTGSRKNIAYHYDLGNDFYRLWLDPSMTYSSAMFSEGKQSIEQAQRNKLNTISEWLAPKRGSRVLEIGCGWGALSRKLAVEHNCSVTGISLSEAQLDFARDRWKRHSDEPLTTDLAGIDEHLPVTAEDAGAISDRLEYRYVDYRDVKGTYDHIVSIEMFEAVGREYWSIYFKRLADLLKREGTAILQVITIDEKNFDGYVKNPDFIQRYIFPGGMLPTKSILTELSESVGLTIAGQTWFGQSYARTLACWCDRFEQRISDVRALGYDERFLRMWKYYLAYCEAGFAIGTTDVGLIKLEKRAN